jgi:hypothetical protein
MHILDHDSCAVLGSRAADAPSYGNPHTGHLALKGSEYEFASLQEVESHPIQFWQRLIEKRRHIRRVGKTIALAGEYCRQLSVELAIGVRLRKTGSGTGSGVNG